MIKKYTHIAAAVIVGLLLTACATNQGSIVVETESVLPGTQVAKKGQNLPLTGTAIEIGQRLPETELVDMKTMNAIDLNDYRGSVLFLSIVPSIDTNSLRSPNPFSRGGRGCIAGDNQTDHHQSGYTVCPGTVCKGSKVGGYPLPVRLQRGGVWAVDRIADRRPTAARQISRAGR